MGHQFTYKYSKLELAQFAMFEENCTPQMKDVQFITETQFSFDRENAVLCCGITVTMTTDTEKPLVKAELRSFFEIQAESFENMQEDGHIMFAPPLLVQFASLCYGSMRGVIFTKTQETPLCNYVLPPMYFGNLIDKGFSVESV